VKQKFLDRLQAGVVTKSPDVLGVLGEKWVNLPL
jgi:hypothetical protein